MMLEYTSLASFDKEFKKLEKRYRSLREDFERMKKAAIELTLTRGIDNQSIVRIPQSGTADIHAYKVRKFACRGLKGGGQSGLRVIFIHEVVKRSITFVEIYYKADQAVENKQRLDDAINSLIR